MFPNIYSCSKNVKKRRILNTLEFFRPKWIDYTSSLFRVEFLLMLHPLFFFLLVVSFFFIYSSSSYSWSSHSKTFQFHFCVDKQLWEFQFHVLGFLCETNNNGTTKTIMESQQILFFPYMFSKLVLERN